MLLLKCCTLYFNKLGKVSSGHGTGNAQFHSNPKERQCQRMLKLSDKCAHLTCLESMLKILQTRLQQYVNWELPDVQAGFRKGRGSRDQIANICWTIEKAREFQKNVYFCFIDYTKASLHIWKFLVPLLLKPHLKDFEHYLASMWNECNCAVVWTFFGIILLWHWNEDWPFPVLWPPLSFPYLLAYWVQQHHLLGFETARLELHHLH